MYKEISIGGHKVPMLSNGATPLYYKQVFNKDIISKIYGAEDRLSEVNECAPELAYIMAKQAEKAKDPAISMNTLNFEKYIEWLESLEATSLLMASEEIMNLYFHDVKPSSEAKKKQGKQNVS